MALTFGVNDPLTVKLWSKALEREVLPATCVGLLVSGNKSMSAVTLKDEVSKAAGDRLRIPFLNLLDQAPIKEGTQIEGAEADPAYTHYDLLLSSDAHAVRRETDMNDQRTEFNFRDDMKYVLANRWTETLEISLLNQLGGNSTGLAHDGLTPGFTGNNPILEPSAARHLFSGGATSEATLAVGDVLDSEDIRRAASIAETTRIADGLPTIKRASLPGKSAAMWGLLIPPRQRDHLYAEAATQGSFFDVQRAAMEGGETTVDQNILRGRYINTTYQFMGTYAGVCIYVDVYTPYGQSVPGTLNPLIDRSIFFGAGAGAIGFGRKMTGTGINKFSWREEIFRYGEQHGIATKAVWGGVKATLDDSGEDLATIVISSHGTAV